MLTVDLGWIGLGGDNNLHAIIVEPELFQQSVERKDNYVVCANFSQANVYQT